MESWNRSETLLPPTKLSQPWTMTSIIKLCCGCVFLVSTAFCFFNTAQFHNKISTSSAQKLFLKSGSNESIANHLKKLTEDPHVAGTPENFATADYVFSIFRRSGLDAHYTDYEVLLTYPLSRSLSLSLSVPQEDIVHLRLKEQPFESDPSTSNPNVIPTFHAYSPSGNVSAQIVFANYGREEDYAVLRQMGIDPKGSIIIAKYAKIYRGDIVGIAAEAGAVAVVVYSDPQDYGGNRTEGYYPQSRWLPPSGVQRGSIYKPIGDPLTPGWPSVADAERLSVDDPQTYAGHYIPQLAKKIYEYNKGVSKPFINLKGFMVGNAVTDSYYDNLGTVNYWWSHAMISDQTYHAILKHCNFRVEDNSPACDTFINYAMDQEFGNIDQYSIYTPPCGKSEGDGKKTFPRFKKSLVRLRRLRGYDPCTESYAEKYYNRADVQKALHANTTSIPYRWTACSDVLIRNWNDSDFSILPIYKELINASGLRIWMYSGDADSVVPVTATRFSLARLRLPVKIRWYPWYSAKQVGGWTEVYKGLTFATIRGAGHEVPLFRPQSAFQLFKSFLSGENLPANA